MLQSLSLLIYLVVGVVLSFWVGLNLQVELLLAEKPTEYAVALFSILAGSLFAVSSIIGDPSMLVSGHWRNAWQDAVKIQGQLQLYHVLYVVYLIVICLAVASEIREVQLCEGSTIEFRDFNLELLRGIAFVTNTTDGGVFVRVLETNVSSLTRRF